MSIIFKQKKFKGTEYEERIRLLDNPMKAAEMGRAHTLRKRKRINGYKY